MKDSRSISRDSLVFAGLLVLLGVGLALSCAWVFGVAPTEARMGIIQKIFYFHVPAALAMYACFVTCGIASLLFLLRRSPCWDALAVSSAETGVLFGLMVLLTGPLWARGTWGAWWVWDDPQLTSTLLLFLIYTTYLFLRRFLGEQPGARRLPAVLAMLGMLDIPIIHYSVRLWRGQHPQVIRGGGGGLAPEMLHALLIAAAVFLLLAVLLIWLRSRLQLAQQRLEELHLDLLEQEGGARCSPAMVPVRGTLPGAGSLVLPALLLLLLPGVLPTAALAQQPAAVPGPAAAAEPAPPPTAAAEPTPAPGPAAVAEPAAAVPATAAVAAPPMLSAAAPPAAAPPAPPERRLSGELLMVVAYVAIWLLTLLFLLYLWRRQQRLDEEIQRLEQDVRRSAR